MIEISLHQPGVISKSILFPTEWNELSLPDLHAVSKSILAGYEQDKLVRAKICIDLLQNRLPEVQNVQNKINLDDAAISLIPLVDFIFLENERTEQPYNEMKLPDSGGITVYGPVSDFNNLVVGEFEEAEQYYFEFSEAPGHEHLASLAAVLYRPKDVPYYTFDSGKGKYVAYDTAPLLPFFQKMKPWELYTIFIWYVGCKNQFPKYFPVMYEGGGGTGEPDPMLFTKCIHNDANPKNGTREQIRTMLLKEYMFDIELQTQKAKELEEKYGK